MKFEVFDSHGRCVMATSSPGALYPPSILRLQHAAGYRHKLDGKFISVKELCNRFYSQLPQEDNNKQSQSDSSSPKLTTLEKPKRKIRKVYCKETNKVYNNMSEAARELGIDPAAVSYAIQVNRPTTSGYTFELKED